MKPLPIKRELFSQGISPKLKGFQYLAEALGAMLNGARCADAEAASRAIKLVGGKRVRQTECCMRYAIRRAWDLGEGKIRELFPNYELPPAVVEFVLIVAWKLEEEHSSR